MIGGGSCAQRTRSSAARFRRPVAPRLDTRRRARDTGLVAIGMLPVLIATRRETAATRRPARDLSAGRDLARLKATAMPTTTAGRTGTGQASPI